MRGYTVRELASYLRVSPDKIRAWIRSGNLKAFNRASHKSQKPRLVILQHQLDEFLKSREVGVKTKPAKQRMRRSNYVDYYPD